MHASTGISGLDHILGGGFPYDRVYLVEGDPGSGKTTLGLQFLREGLRLGEKVLYVTLSETRSELAAVAESHGWTLDGMAIHELAAGEESAFKPDDQYTFFHPSEVELGETTKAVLSEVEQVNPTRVVFDSLSEMRLLAREPLRYRRQILGLKQFFVGRRCTVLLLDDRTAQPGDLQLQSNPATSSCRVWRTGSSPWSSSRPSSAPSAGAYASSSCAASNFRAASTISISPPADSPCFRGSSRRKRGRTLMGATWTPVFPSSTSCSAAGSTAGPPRCSSARRARASRRWQRRWRWPRRNAASTS
jgi:KaiC/GvpD/RAD55 family RecA-like ATPase